MYKFCIEFGLVNIMIMEMVGMVNFGGGVVYFGVILKMDFE